MQLDATNRTPAVSVSSTGIEIKGECYPEDITAFAEPVMQALRDQLEGVESVSYTHLTLPTKRIV